MRVRLGIFLALFCAAAAAQQRPPKLEPLPEPLPPPPFTGSDEPSVRIPVQRGDKVEEIRQGGRVVTIKVTPANGKPYFLDDASGKGGWTRRESLDDGVRPPMWPIYSFD